MASSSSAGAAGSKRKRSAAAEEEEEEEDMDYVPESKGGRLWSTKDECTLLVGLKKLQKRSDMTGLYAAVGAKLDCKATKNQLADKVRKLKRKFTSNKSKGDPAVYKLMVQVWGDHEVVDSDDSDDDSYDDSEEVKDDPFLKTYPNVCRHLVHMYSCANIRVGIELDRVVDLIAQKMETSLSKEELEDMERGWDRCDLMYVQAGLARMEQMKKQKKLIEKAANNNY
ncbi:hypothetical protein SSX86_030138 [Deinandra increscens subsp. villosa]|uniref:Glabrous enhancer-binding protein-like DBD domain-containing protein n=1 Tax=Deinandra increscens subsp. villosa TaxID=3103831 RepID=A0AAP0GMF8_9ASTR